MDVFARRRAQLAAARPHVNNVSGPGDVGRVLSLPRVEKHPPIVWRNFLNAGATGIKLRPIQEEALAAIAATDGGLFPIGVGHGKSLIALLAGTVLRADLAIVLVAPATVPQMGDWLRECKMHYRMPETLVVSWGRLSRPDASDWLTSLDVADKRVVLVADEAHFVRNPDAARTKRLMRWLKEHSHVKFVALSGTLTTRRLADFAHIAHRTLGKSSPLPIGPEGRVWDTVLAGEPYNVADLAAVVPLWKWATVTQSAQPPRGIITSDQKKALSLAFGERLRTCPGVVLTQDASCQSSLYLAAWTPDNVPKEVEQVWAEAVAASAPRTRAARTFFMGIVRGSGKGAVQGHPCNIWTPELYHGFHNPQKGGATAGYRAGTLLRPTGWAVSSNWPRPPGSRAGPSRTGR